jgi:MFS family permease
MLKDAAHFAGLVGEDKIRWTFCLLMAAFPFMQFFGAPILGGLSDRYRKQAHHYGINDRFRDWLFSIFS